MASFDPNADSAKLLWDRLQGGYTFSRESTYDLLLEGHEFSSSELEHHSTGQSKISTRTPTDSPHQYECLQISDLKYIVRKSGLPKKATETRVFRFFNGEWSIWRSGSDGVAVEKSAVLTLRHEIAPPVGQDNKKVQGPSFRVVQEPKKAGKEEGDRPDLRFFIGEGAGWEMHSQTKKGEKMMTQKDTYKISQAKGIGTFGIAICGHGVVADANTTDVTPETLSQRIPKLRFMAADASAATSPPTIGSSNPSAAPSISQPANRTPAKRAAPRTSPASGNGNGNCKGDQKKKKEEEGAGGAGCKRTAGRMVKSGSGDALIAAANGDGGDVDRRTPRLNIQR